MDIIQIICNFKIKYYKYLSLLQIQREILQGHQRRNILSQIFASFLVNSIITLIKIQIIISE